MNSFSGTVFAVTIIVNVRHCGNDLSEYSYEFQDHQIHVCYAVFHDRQLWAYDPRSRLVAFS